MVLFYKYSSPQGIRDTFNSLSNEFKTMTVFHEYEENWWFSLEGVKTPNDVSYLCSTDSNDPSVIYRTSINIWLNEESFDFWLRRSIVKVDGEIRIILSDYNGIRVLSEHLVTLLTIHRTAEMVEQNDVFGYHFENGASHLSVWKMSEATGAVHSGVDQYHDISRVRETCVKTFPIVL